MRNFAVILGACVVAAFTPSLSPAKNVIEMKIDGTIHNGTTGMIEAGLAKAKDSGAEALLIEMDTPGGMLDATRDIVKLFLNSEIPILVYVAPSGAHAGSAGTFITMAAHVAAMAPGTNIGAAHPISATGSDPEKDGGKHLAQKIENDTSAFIETIAKQRGRNAEWGRKAVIDSAAIDETEAVKLHVVDFVAKDKEEFLAMADGRRVKIASGERTLSTKGAVLVPLEVSGIARLKNWLAEPSIMFILILIAGMGLYVEMSHPGLILPAVTAGIAVVLLMIATSALPMSVVGIGLILLGFGLLIAEVYVTSFGLLGAGGVIAFVVGSYLLFDPSETDLKVPRGLIYGTAAGLATVGVMIGMAVGRVRKLPQTAGAEGLIGAQGVVSDRIVPGAEGRVFVFGEYWNAVSDEVLETGTKVEVVHTTGLLAKVRRSASMGG